MIYMPGQNYADIARRLTSAGLTSNTPCAIISRATTKYQRTHRTTVLDLHRAPQLSAPTLLVVGEVVRLADPAAAVEEFMMPEFPAALFQTIHSQVPPLGADEEPMS